MSASARLTRALISLEGLSVGDAYGERFFRHRPALTRMWATGLSDFPQLQALDLGAPPWRWTDDTAMALAIVATLQTHGAIQEYDLAQRFSLAYADNPARGYGPGMHKLLPKLRGPGAWESAPRDLFKGQGSFGNGSAMRATPVGAYFADDLDAVVDNARRSAVVTHAHPEGLAGAIAVAVAAAYAWRLREAPPPPPIYFIDLVLQHLPPSQVADKMQEARDLPPATTVFQAAQTLGSGQKVTAQDTVPFVVWSAAQHLNHYAHALWHTISGLGDMDTTAAMVGGIVALYTGVDTIPAEWRNNREPLPNIA